MLQYLEKMADHFRSCWTSGHVNISRTMSKQAREALWALVHHHFPGSSLRSSFQWINMQPVEAVFSKHSETDKPSVLVCVRVYVSVCVCLCVFTFEMRGLKRCVTNEEYYLQMSGVAARAAHRGDGCGGNICGGAPRRLPALHSARASVFALQHLSIQRDALIGVQLISGGVCVCVRVCVGGRRGACKHTSLKVLSFMLILLPPSASCLILSWRARDLLACVRWLCVYVCACACVRSDWFELGLWEAHSWNSHMAPSEGSWHVTAHANGTEMACNSTSSTHTAMTERSLAFPPDLHLSLPIQILRQSWKNPRTVFS